MLARKILLRHFIIFNRMADKDFCANRINNNTQEIK